MAYLILTGIVAVLLLIACVLALFQRKAEEQPAQESYFFSRSFIDLKETIKILWEKNKHSAAARNAVIATVIYVIGGIVTVITTALHITLIGSLFLIVYIGFTIIWIADRIYTNINKIRTACPEPSCQASFRLPFYTCECKAVHTNLSPGKYGILNRKCNCGRRLPTTFINGRGKLKAYCPVCRSPLSGETSSRQYAVPVIGGPSVGKTCYINMTIHNIKEKVAPQHNWNVTFLDKNNEVEYQHAINAMKQGNKPSKTDFDSLNAYQLMLKLPKDSVSRRIYFYDIAGEKFATGGTVLKNNAFSFADGFIFLIDPLSLSSLVMELMNCINVSNYGVSDEDFGDIFDIMLGNMKDLFGLSSKDILDKNLAIVINKCDVPQINEKVGDVAVHQYMSSHPECKSYADAKNEVCKNFLVQYEAGNFVREVEKNFKNVQYFTCSALGHNQDGQSYQGIDVEKPLLWILNRIDNSINVNIY